MTGRRRYTHMDRLVACTGKIAYDDPAIAHKAAARVSSHGRRAEPYRCACGRWHVGTVLGSRAQR